MRRFIDALDLAMRIYMRARTWIAPVGMARTTAGFRMLCDTRDFIQRRIFYFGIYEPNLTHYMRSRVGRGDHVADVGANVGYMTLLASSLVGQHGGVTAVEATPATFATLKQNLALNGVANVTPLNMAATANACTVDIVAGETRNSGSNSIRLASGPSSSAVTGDRLSRLIGDKCAAVTFIKIDVEGSEAPILQSLLDDLDLYPRLATIAVELAADGARFLALFRERGFKVYALPNNYLIGYLVVRAYLARSHEHEFVVKLPVENYDPEFRDYVFEREPTPAAIQDQRKREESSVVHA